MPAKENKGDAVLAMHFIKSGVLMIQNQQPDRALQL